MQLSMEVIGIPQALDLMHRTWMRDRLNVAVCLNAATMDGNTLAKRLTPVKTGRLRRGNKIRQSHGGTEVLLLNELYNDVPYAVYVCYGTRKMRPRDFMTPAIVEARRSFLARLGRELGG